MGATDENPGTEGLSSHDFIQVVWNDLSVAFANHFGPKWSPEVNTLYEDTLRAAFALAQAADGEVAQPEPPTQLRVLTNYAGRARG